MHTIEELREQQYREFLEKSGDSLSRRDFETLIRSPGVMDKHIMAAGGLKRALALLVAGASC
jgi:hypothetical protein